MIHSCRSKKEVKPRKWVAGGSGGMSFGKLKLLRKRVGDSDSKKSPGVKVRQEL